LRLGEKATITYVDQTGVVTVREIQPREFITVGGDSFVLAHCYLRGGTRYFRMDRIRKIN
jgi:predicted DNA-binding transcriptional regulator YafY